MNQIRNGDTLFQQRTQPCSPPFGDAQDASCRTGRDVVDGQQHSVTGRANHLDFALHTGKNALLTSDASL